MRLWAGISHCPVMEARELKSHGASPSAGVIDSQSVKTTESGGIRSFDAGKEVPDRKRHVVVDTPVLMVGLVVHSAGIQDRDGAPDLLKTMASSIRPVLFEVSRVFMGSGPGVGGSSDPLFDALWQYCHERRRCTEQIQNI